MFNHKSIKIIFTESAMNQLIAFTQIDSDSKERGGVLMGELYPNENIVTISNVLESKADVSHRCKFEMNVTTTQDKITKIWKDSGGITTYLGDWHSHPESRPSPSWTDKLTFTRNYFGSSIDQSFLIYVIVGNTPKIENGIWIGMRTSFRLIKTVKTNDFVWIPIK